MPTITAVRDHRPGFLEGKDDSISVHLKKARSHFNHPVANMNTLTFGRPTQNSLSHALKELFGVEQTTEHGEGVPSKRVNKSKGTNYDQGSVPRTQGGDDESDISRSHKSRNSVQNTQRRGGGGPDDSDGDDSDEGKGNGPRGGPCKASPRGPRKNNPFDSNQEEISPQAGKPPPEPQFDTKLKVDAIPTWDGNSDNLR